MFDIYSVPRTKIAITCKLLHNESHNLQDEAARLTPTKPLEAEALTSLATELELLARDMELSLMVAIMQRGR